MPLYEYRCTGCKNTEEVLQTIAERQAGIGAPVCCSGCDSPYEPIISRTHIAGEVDTALCRDALKTRDMLDLPDEYDREKILTDEAKRRGVSTTGKWYDPQLATYEGDPMAWVGSIADVKAVCKIRGWECIFRDGRYEIKIPLDMSKGFYLSQQAVHAEVGT